MTTTTPPAANPPLFHPAPGTPAGDTPTAALPPAAARTPWYRRAWVLAIAAVILALLSFAGGFVAGNAAALFNGVLGVPAGGATPPGWSDGDLDGDGFGPGRPGFGDRDSLPGQGDFDGDGDESGTTSTN
ncbi:hypothetical protein ACFPER_03415 [Agromyces aurantiacus]|uniref:Uncharacterized protein n=1 Tax=Agromyces aurantiacus TaxID=165814 RepID=A0ABV9R143_9MICO|nr:hypothetical protein [Agromyces aurantiacus]MBM7506141.1 hypothetical protein [Agromyces aurantiacus]